MSIGSYEVMFIIRPDLDDSQIADKIEKIKNQLVAKGCQIDDLETWGRRSLATEFNGHQEGYYVLIYFKSEKNKVTDIEKFFRISEDFIRYLIVQSQGKLKPVAPEPAPAAKTEEKI